MKKYYLGGLIGLIAIGFYFYILIKFPNGIPVPHANTYLTGTYYKKPIWGFFILILFPIITLMSSIFNKQTGFNLFNQNNNFNNEKYSRNFYWSNVFCSLLSILLLYLIVFKKYVIKGDGMHLLFGLNFINLGNIKLLEKFEPKNNYNFLRTEYELSNPSIWNKTSRLRASLLLIIGLIYMSFTFINIHLKYILIILPLLFLLPRYYAKYLYNEENKIGSTHLLLDESKIIVKKTIDLLKKQILITSISVLPIIIYSIYLIYSKLKYGFVYHFDLTNLLFISITCIFILVYLIFYNLQFDKTSKKKILLYIMILFLNILSYYFLLIQIKDSLKDTYQVYSTEYAKEEMKKPNSYFY